jgi:hypothetical protein
MDNSNVKATTIIVLSKNPKKMLEGENDDE